MDLFDIIDDERCEDIMKNDLSTINVERNKYISQNTMNRLLQYNLSQLEIESEKSNGNRDVYINRELIFSDKYIDAIKSLGETRYCSKNIIESARTILQHHHGDKYEDLYFIDSETNNVLSRTDYRINEQEVLPTSAMKEMARNNPNIISIHNHPTDALPSYEDIKTCYLVGYKYGLVVCHGGDIFQYKTLEDINKIMYNSECSIYYKREQTISNQFELGLISKEQFITQHQINFIELSAHLIDAGVVLKEVLWNGKQQRLRNDSANSK